MDKQEYCGWANWATWNMALWVDNVEGVYKAKQAIGTWRPNIVKRFCGYFYPKGQI